MKEEIIKLETALLAKEKGFDWIDKDKPYYGSDFNIHGKIEKVGIKLLTYWFNQYKKDKTDSRYNGISLRPTQSLLQKWLREIRNTHIEIHRNASGYYWSMCKSDGGTDLGWSDHSGPNIGGVWNSFEEALENALAIQLTYDLPDNTTEIKHWGNYAELAIQKYNIMKEKN